VLDGLKDCVRCDVMCYQMRCDRNEWYGMAKERKTEQTGRIEGRGMGTDFVLCLATGVKECASGGSALLL
jgi:hypothetical protein